MGARHKMSFFGRSSTHLCHVIALNSNMSTKKKQHCNDLDTPTTTPGRPKAQRTLDQAVEMVCFWFLEQVPKLTS